MAYPSIHRAQLRQEAEELEPLSPSSTRLLSILSREDWDPDEVIEVASLDAGLTARLISMANSAANAPEQSIATLDGAMMRLGAGTVLSVSVASAVRRRLEVPLPAYGLGEGEIWRHSVAASLAVEGLRARTSVRIPTESATAALLHDFGKLVLSQHLDEAGHGLFVRAREAGLGVIQSELELLETTHAEVGGLIARSWGLPETLALAIECHHDPGTVPKGNPRYVQVCDAVHLAEVISSVGLDDEDDPEPECAPSSATLAALERLGLPEGTIDELAPQVRTWLDELSAWYD